MSDPTKPNSRAQTLRKLLALGELHRSEIDHAMGGDKPATQLALEELIQAGEVYAAMSSYGTRVYRLRGDRLGTVFAEVTVTHREVVKVVNFPTFPEGSEC